MRPFAARGPFGDVVQQSQFAPAIDQRDPSAVRLRTSAKPEDRPRDQVVLESFRSDLTQVAELDETASELDGRLPGQDLAGLGGLLQPRSRVDLCPDHDVEIGRRADRRRIRDCNGAGPLRASLGSIYNLRKVQNRLSGTNGGQ